MVKKRLFCVVISLVKKEAVLGVITVVNNRQFSVVNSVVKKGRFGWLLLCLMKGSFR